MAGSGTNYFENKRNEYQTAAQEAQEKAQVLSSKVAGANAALAILSKPQISQPEAESLIQFYTEAQ